MDKDEVIVLLRSAAMAEKQGLPFHNLERVFRTDFGCDIPYRNFGFPNLKSFIQDAADAGHFIIVNGRDGVYLKPGSCAKTDHIAVLVQKQNSSKKRNKRAPAFQTRRRPFSQLPRRPPPPMLRAQNQSQIPPLMKRPVSYGTTNHLDPGVPPLTKQPVNNRTTNHLSPWIRPLITAPITSNNSQDEATVEKRNKIKVKSKVSIPPVTNRNKDTDVRGYPLISVESTTAFEDKNNNDTKRMYREDDLNSLKRMLSDAEKTLSKIENKQSENNENIKDNKQMETCDNSATPADKIRVTVSGAGRSVKVVEKKEDYKRIVKGVDEMINSLNNLSFSESPMSNYKQWPCIGEYFLMGDNFFLELARYLRFNIKVNKLSETSGFCKSSLTIPECISLLKTADFIPPKVILLIGATDILKRNRFEDIAEEYWELIEILSQVVYKLAICTVPPLLNLSRDSSRSRTLKKLNRFLETIEIDTKGKIKVLDVYWLLDSQCHNYSLYELNCDKNNVYDRHYPVLNNVGCQLIYSNLRHVLRQF